MLPMPNPKALFFLPSAAAPETEPTEPGPLGKCGFHRSPPNTNMVQLGSLPPPMHPPHGFILPPGGGGGG